MLRIGKTTPHTNRTQRTNEDKHTNEKDINELRTELRKELRKDEIKQDELGRRVIEDRDKVKRLRRLERT